MSQRLGATFPLICSLLLQQTMNACVNYTVGNDDKYSPQTNKRFHYCELKIPDGRYWGACKPPLEVRGVSHLR